MWIVACIACLSCVAGQDLFLSVQGPLDGQTGNMEHLQSCSWIPVTTHGPGTDCANSNVKSQGGVTSASHCGALYLKDVDCLFTTWNIQQSRCYCKQTCNPRKQDANCRSFEKSCQPSPPPVPPTPAPRVPARQLPGGGKLPMLVMGDGMSWGSPSNFTFWVQTVGPGAGINTAWDYGTQRLIPAQIAASGFARTDVFLTTMVPCSGYDGGVEPMNASMARWYIKQDLEQLQTSYVDLLLLHHVCAKWNETAEVWSVLEATLESGQARAIGVSNFDTPDLARLQSITKHPIAVNECHFAVGQMDYEMISFAEAAGIALEAYSPLKSPIAFDNPVLQRLAAQHNVSVPTLMMRYLGMRNISVLTATDNPAHVMDDIAMFSFELTEDDLAELDRLQAGNRTCSDCYARPCRICQNAVQKYGCKTTGATGWPTGSKCMACAREHNSSLMAACVDDYMLAKACSA